MTGTEASYRSSLSVGRDGFASLLRAEWTKFRTVRGWVVGLLAAAVVTVLIGMVSTSGGERPCNGGGGTAGAGQSSSCQPPVGPGGEAVTDGFYFVHQPLDGDGSITVRVTALTGMVPPDGEDASAGLQPGLEEWTKAGLIIKESTTQGSAYAAIMVTGGHGVRMQHNFTNDTAGGPGGVSASSPRWLRLTRTGDELAGYESADGETWTTVGTARLDGLSSTVEAGLFVASPDHEVTTQSLGGVSSTSGFTQATATFDSVGQQGRWPSGAWTGDDVRGSSGGLATRADEFEESNGVFTVTGSGDIAPAVAGPEGNTIEQSLVGAFAGLIVVIVVAAMSMTTEYRRSMIRTTFAASPRRGRVLAAKAVVVGSVTFVAGLAATVTAFELVGRIRRDKGHVILPVTSLTELRVVVGTAALLAVAAVLALALGTVLRRSAAAVTAAIVLIVLPYILAIASVLPSGPAEWLLRVTPAAAFAIQQSIPEYSQVSRAYTPVSGYYPLAPWAGFAVLCAWTALALGLATVLIRRRDA